VVSGAFYVDSVNGSDSNDGLSPSTAWQTLTKVQNNLSSLKPGDSVLFASGDTFSGGLTLPAGMNGAANAPITFSSYGTGALPVIDGGGSAAACFYARATGGGGVPLWSYITINGLECRNTTEYAIIFYQNLGGSAGMPGIVIENMYIHNTGPSKDDHNYRNQLMFLDENQKADGVQVLNNRIGACGGHNCVNIQDDTGSPVVSGNTCYGPWNHNCIDLKAVTGATVANNTSYGPASGGSSFYIENTEIPAADITWQEDVTYNSPNGFECETGGSGANYVTCRAYNNTAYLVNQSAIVTGSGCTQPMTWDVNNNILDTTSSYYFAYTCSSGRTIQWDYNDDCASQGACPSSSSAYIGSHDYDGVNPLYVNAAGDDFHLQSGSPCIGAALAGVTANNDDMGAY